MDGLDSRTIEFLKQKEEAKRLEQIHQICFNLMDIDGDGIISVLDLIKIVSHLSEEMPLGQEAMKLLEKYMDHNVRKFSATKKLELDYSTYHAIIPRSCLVDDLE
eukprot:CAMPEP_0116885346 /NCGR_PEP_ID=MMETSP0463-20121206/18652_1 /TAXON_ID=181622 /ORGANISM="Strombidinopsis sp, Strain SopsisLIS2011" /LENGTH=104 /DNA_ID=CAMNT_0004543587 /DNA_START=526 /DNA_END=840 /DNA_ORIENTATION=-